MSRFMVPFLDFFRKATDAPMEYGEIAGLMALSTIAVGRRWVDAGDGVQANLFSMIVGDSSVARKSTSVNYAKKMIYFVEPRRLAPVDYTMEGLMKWMGEAPDGEPKGSKLKQNCLCLFSDEFGSDLSRMTAYGPTMQADFCRLYDGQNITKIRVASPPLTVENPRVSFLAGAAYQMLQAHLQAKDWTNGFLMRFLYVAPGQMRPKFALQPKKPQLDWDLAQNGLSAILTELNTPVQHGPPAQPGLAPAMRTWFGLSIDPAAQIQYEAMCQWFDSILSTLSFLSQIYVERFKTSVQKVALLYQIDDDSTRPIGVGAMQRALNFCGGICWPSFKVAYEKTTSSEFKALAEMVEQILAENGGSVPVRDLATRFRHNQQLPKVIDYLIASDLGRRKKVITNGVSVDMLELTT